MELYTVSPVGDICEHRLALTRGITSFSSGSRAFVLSDLAVDERGNTSGRSAVGSAYGWGP